MAARTTLEQYRVRLEAQRKARGIAESTLAQERSTLRHLCREWDKTRRAPGSLDIAWLEDYLFGPGGRAEGISPNTFNKKIAHLTVLIEWLARRGIVRNELLDALVHKKGGKVNRARLPIGQMEQMIETAEDEWERFVLSFGIHTLGRWSELRHVRRRDIHLDAGYIKWWREKTDEWDELPITFELDRALRRWIVFIENALGRPLRPEDYIIPYRRPLGWHKYRWEYVPYVAATESIRTCVKKHAAPLCGGFDVIKGQGVHLLRRSAARELYEALKTRGVPDPIRVVMAMLGHKNVSTTEIYIGVERDRQTRDTLMRGASLLSVDKTNVTELRRVSG